MAWRDTKKRQRTVLLHDVQELDNDLRRGTDQDLTATHLLGVVDGVERIVENGGADHFDGLFFKSRFSNRFQMEMRYLLKATKPATNFPLIFAFAIPLPGCHRAGS